MDIHRLVFTKADLSLLPKAERRLLLLLGHASNEINVLSKLILMARKGDVPSKIVDHAETGQIFILLRMLIGKLHEAWKLYAARAKADKIISDIYVSRLDGQSAAALDRLNNQFKSGSVLTTIRNKMSFHYKDDDDLVEKSFQAISGSEPLEFYLTQTTGNTFYYASELLVEKAAIDLSSRPGEDEAKAFGGLCKLVIDVSRDFTLLFEHLMDAIISTRLPSLETSVESFPDGPKLSAIDLPYFIDFERN